MPRKAINSMQPCLWSLFRERLNIYLLTFKGTLNSSKSGVRFNVCWVMTPLKSQFSLGTHNMAEGHITKGFVSAGCTGLLLLKFCCCLGGCWLLLKLFWGGLKFCCLWLLLKFCLGWLCWGQGSFWACWGALLKFCWGCCCCCWPLGLIPGWLFWGQGSFWGWGLLLKFCWGWELKFCWGLWLLKFCCGWVLKFCWGLGCWGWGLCGWGLGCCCWGLGACCWGAIENKILPKGKIMPWPRKNFALKKTLPLKIGKKMAAA